MATMVLKRIEGMEYLLASPNELKTLYIPFLTIAPDSWRMLLQISISTTVR